MICPICGTYNEDNLQICCSCGNNMTFRTQEHYEYTHYTNQQSQQPEFRQLVYPHPDYQQANYRQSPVQPQKNDPGKILGIVGFALSMGSIVFSDGLTLAIVGLVLSAIAMKQSAKEGFKNGFAKAGLIISIIVTAITIVFAVAIIAFYIFYLMFIIGVGVLAI